MVSVAEGRSGATRTVGRLAGTNLLVDRPGRGGPPVFEGRLLPRSALDAYGEVAAPAGRAGRIAPGAGWQVLRDGEQPRQQWLAVLGAALLARRDRPQPAGPAAARSSTRAGATMSIQIHDTLAGRKRELGPARAGEARRSTSAGPTVYDAAHLGHARSYVAWDVVVRHLRARGFEVKFVRNFTDVDDKIIAAGPRAGRGADGAGGAASPRPSTATWTRSATSGPTSRRGSRRTSRRSSPSSRRWWRREYAYAPGNGDVYYAVRKFADYGRLSRRNLDDLQAGARVEPGEAKRDPLDFALWKAAKPGEPSWASPWGPGRPGWHIECSAMTRKHLGAAFDLHAGGKDLVFPHHTNEIAQSAAATSDAPRAEDFAQYWLHNGFLNIDDEKMSKSLGNFFTIGEVLARYDAEGLRFFLLGTHYRRDFNFSVGLLGEAERRVRCALRDPGEGRPPRGRGRAAPAVGRWSSGRWRRSTTTSTRRRCWAYLAEAFTAANALADRKGKKTPDDRTALAGLRPGRPGGGAGAGDPAAAAGGGARRHPREGRRPAGHRPGGGGGPHRRARRGSRRARLRPGRRDPGTSSWRSGVALMDGPGGTTWTVE